MKYEAQIFNMYLFYHNHFICKWIVCIYHKIYDLLEWLWEYIIWQSLFMYLHYVFIFIYYIIIIICYITTLMHRLQ